MYKYHIVRGIAVVTAMILTSTALADKKNTTSYQPNSSSSGYSKIITLAKSMGGISKILSLKGMEYISNGSRYEPEQSIKPRGKFKLVGNYQYKIVSAFNSQQSYTEWNLEVRYPFIEQRSFTEVINGEQGAVYGFDTIIAPPQAPMLSTRLGSRVKQNLVSSPLALIHRAKQYSAQVKFLGTTEFNGRRQQVVSIPGWNQPIKLFIDVKSKLLSKAETMEDDSVYGDTRWEVIYKNWTNVEGIKVPLTLKHKINGRVINKEVRSSITVNKNIDSSLFEIPVELQSTFNPDQFSWGIRSSQWFNRMLAFAIPFDLDQRTAATSQIVEVAPKVFHAKSFTHHSMIIEMKDYLIVTEAPLYEERSQVVINEIKTRWPNKPIKYLIATHFHNDHVGGIRAYAEIGATIIVGSQTKDHYEAILKARHTVFPDAYSKNPVDVTIKTVEAKHDMVLTDGSRNVRIFDVENRHAIGTIIPFVEDANLVFVSDLYSPEFFAPLIPQLFLGWSEDLLAALTVSPLDIQWIIGGHGGVSSYDTFVTQVELSLN
jgi:glyoxylase-like metal-dependent hydrolase (beta-lactamase superfamily II)